MATSAERPKRVRCTCAKCGAIKYHEAAAIDQTEPFLCSRCDDLFVAWQNAAQETAEEDRRTLEAFLARRARR